MEVKLELVITLHFEIVYLCVLSFTFSVILLKYQKVSTKKKIFKRTGVMADTLFPVVTENATTNGDVSNATESEIQETLTPSAEEELARILNLVIRPVLIVFGTIGNGLSFYIMRQGSLKKMSTCFYLSILALADTSKCEMFWFINLHKNVSQYDLSSRAHSMTARSEVL